MHKETEQGTLCLSACVLDLQRIQGYHLGMHNSVSAFHGTWTRLYWVTGEGTKQCDAQHAAPFQGQDFIDNVRMQVSDLAAQDGWRCEWSPVEQHNGLNQQNGLNGDSTPLKITWRPQA
eukprot:1892858-Amphidinium_carterae.1